MSIKRVLCLLALSLALSTQTEEKRALSVSTIKLIWRCGMLEGAAVALETSPIDDGQPERVRQAFQKEGCQQIKDWMK